MKPEQTKVMYDSDEAASIRTVTGWVSRTGRYWGADEHMARFDGSTHKRCECGEILANNSYCRTCYDRRDHAKYMALPTVAWDGKTPLHLHGTDLYFFDADYLLEHCAEVGCQPKELPLVVCVPKYAREIDPVEHYADDLPEDGEVPPELAAAFEQLNAAIKACTKPLCWYPGKQAVTPESLPELEAADAAAAA